MTTKQKPSARLPWKVHRHATSGIEIGSEDLDGAGDYACNAYCAEDAEYIVRAANAYPKLVEALRNAHACLMNGQEVALGAGIIDAENTLRELGEAE